MLNSFDEIESVYMNVKIPCPFCSGLNEKCPECKGTGKFAETRLVSFQELVKAIKENL